MAQEDKLSGSSFTPHTVTLAALAPGCQMVHPKLDVERLHVRRGRPSKPSFGLSYLALFFIRVLQALGAPSFKIRDLTIRLIECVGDCTLYKRARYPGTCTTYSTDVNRCLIDLEVTEEHLWKLQRLSLFESFHLPVFIPSLISVLLAPLAGH